MHISGADSTPPGPTPHSSSSPFFPSVSPPPTPTLFRLPVVRTSAALTTDSNELVLISRHENDDNQRERERKLEALVALSEDARIEAEAEAGRLQAFVDEMRVLGPPFGRNWRNELRAAD